jgi:hypothetical protein
VCVCVCVCVSLWHLLPDAACDVVNHGAGLSVLPLSSALLPCACVCPAPRAQTASTSAPASAPAWTRLRAAFAVGGLAALGAASITLVPSSGRHVNLVALVSAVGLAITAEAVRGVLVLTNIRGHRVLAPMFATATLVALAAVAVGVPGSGTSLCVRVCTHERTRSRGPLPDTPPYTRAHRRGIQRVRIPGRRVVPDRAVTALCAVVPPPDLCACRGCPLARRQRGVAVWLGGQHPCASGGAGGRRRPVPARRHHLRRQLRGPPTQRRLCGRVPCAGARAGCWVCERWGTCPPTLRAAAHPRGRRAGAFPASCSVAGSRPHPFITWPFPRACVGACPLLPPPSPVPLPRAAQ